MPKAKREVKEERPANQQSICSRIVGMVEESINLTGKWEQNQVKWHKMRMRIKKEKTFPFVGCANIRMPTIESKIRKLKANLINTVFGIRPILQAIPSPSGNWDTANKIEKFLDHLIMDVMKFKAKAVVGVDQSLEKGFVVFKPYWKTEIIKRIETFNLEDLSPEEALFLFSSTTQDAQVAEFIKTRFDVDLNPLVVKENSQEIEKIVSAINSGEKSIKVSFCDVLFDAPDVAMPETERIYVPTDSGYDPQSCSWLVHEFLLPIKTVEDNAEYKGWDIGEISSLKDTYDRKNRNQETGEVREKDIDSQKDVREGITVSDYTGKVRIWEYYGWYDINGDGEEEKCVITLAPDYDKVLRKISIPFYSGKFPFVKLFYELTDDRWFSHRGVPELIEDIVKEIDMQHNQKLDQQTMRNSPMYAYRAGMINKNTVQFVFGQGLPVSGMQQLSDIITPLNNSNPNVEFSYKDEQMILESKAEELIGQVDFSLQSMINRRQPRTLGEVQLQFQSQQQVFSLDADIYRMAFEELFNWIWELWCQYGSDNYEFAYFGKNGWEPIRLSKEECQGKYKLVVRGNDQNTNQQLNFQKAQLILQGQQNEFAIQSGVVTPQNIAEGYKRFYQELDIPQWEALVTMPPPPQPVPSIQQTAPSFKPKFKELTDSEQAQVLSGMGLQPDVKGRSLKSAAKVQEKMHEQSIKDQEKKLELIKIAQEQMSLENEIENQGDKELAST